MIIQPSYGSEGTLFVKHKLKVSPEFLETRHHTPRIRRLFVDEEKRPINRTRQTTR